MSGSQLDQRRDAADRLRRKKIAESPIRRSRDSAAKQPPPFSPLGRHGALRALLLEVGNVLSRDVDGSLSRVSLSALRLELSTFVKVSRQDAGVGEVSVGSSTTRKQRGSGASGALSGSEAAERAAKRSLREANDAKIITRLKGASHGV